MTESDRSASERELRTRALEQEVNALCLRHGEVARYLLPPGAVGAEDATRASHAMEKRSDENHRLLFDATDAQAIETLRRSESELRDFVENASIGLHRVGPDGAVLWANQTELDLLGYTREEYIGRHISNFHADQSVIEDILVRLTSGETLLNHSARLRHKDGSIRHVLINSNTLVEDGKFIHTRCFTRDITDQKKAQDALQQNEAFSRSIIESSSDCIKVLDLDGNLLALLSGQKLLGIEDIHPLLNKPWINFWEGSDRPAAQLAINAAVAGGKGSFVGCYRTPSGTYQWWDVAVSPILDERRQPLQLLAVSRDVTQRRRAELNLAFLASVSRDLVQRTNVDEMMRAVGAKMGAHLQLSQCAFVDIDETAERVVVKHEWHRDDVPGIAGVHRFADFVGQKFMVTARAGEAIVVSDVAAESRADPLEFAALKIASFICMPLMRDVQWRFALCLHKSEAYSWREDEIELARELTERIWTRLERLRAEAELRISERRYRTLFESLDDGFFIIEKVEGEVGAPLDFRYTEVNNAFEVQSGMQEVVGKTIRQLLPNIPENWFQTYDAVLRTGESARFESELVEAGRVRVLKLHAFRVEAEAHAFVAVIFEDITARQQSDNALHDAAWRLRYATESAQLTFVEVEFASGMARTPENFAAVMGYVPPAPDADGSLGASALLEHVVPPDRAKVTAALQEFFDGKDAGTLDYRVLGDDQIERWIETKWSTLPDPHGKPLKSFATNLDITRRKQDEKALRQSEERFRALVTASSDVVYRMSPDWREMRQLDGQNFIADTAEPNVNWLQQYIHPDDHLRVMAVIHEAIRTKGLFEMEHQVVTVDGSLGWTYSHAVPLLDADGDIVEWFGTASDVTEHRRAAQALRDSEDRYRTLFNSMDEGYCIAEVFFDENNKPVDYLFLEVNPSFEALTGLHGALGKRMREFVPDLEKFWFETYGKVALTGESIRFISEAKPMNRWFDVYAFRLGGAESRKVAILFTNITERKKAEEALRKSEERFRALFDWGPIAMYSCDSSGVIREYNQGAVKLWGREPLPGDTDEQFRGSFKTYLPDGTFVPHAQTAMTKILQNEAPAMHDVEVVVERPDGSRITLVVNVVPLKNDEGQVTGVIACFYDVTERSRLERKTLEQAQALADLDHRKDEFLAMLSHELRNPLAPILNAVHLLRLQKNEDPLQRQARTIIERQVGQLKHLVDDLLEVSRISSGRVQLRQQQIVLGDIARRAVETAQPLITQHRHALTVSMPPEPICLQADAARLEQVLVNLLTNAAKYTEDGGRIALTIERTTSSEGDTAVLRVRDSGIGIAPELLPHVFDLFTQADRSLDRSQGGLGIGLCLVQRLVELHGGSVEVSSVVGQGSEFVVRLPVVVASLPVAAPLLIQPLQQGAKTCRVLLVDDNVDAAQTVAMLLDMSGHQCRMAHDGPSGLDAALAWQPDVVLLDIGLPGLNGYEVARQIRQQPLLKNVVLIALTGYGLEADRQRSQEAGFDHHLVKPADFDEIEKILASLSQGDGSTGPAVALTMPK